MESQLLGVQFEQAEIVVVVPNIAAVVDIVDIVVVGIVVVHLAIQLHYLDNY